MDVKVSNGGKIIEPNFSEKNVFKDDIETATIELAKVVENEETGEIDGDKPVDNSTNNVNIVLRCKKECFLPLDPFKTTQKSLTKLN